MISRRVFLSAVGSSALASAVPLAAQPQGAEGRAAGQRRAFAGVRCCWCPPGRFVMGSPATEAGRRADEAQVDVTLTRGFWTSSFEVTQGQWRTHVGDFPDRPPTAEFGVGDDAPMYWVNYLEAEHFCDRLTTAAHQLGDLPTHWSFRLPTEAQWEYACRAGTMTSTAFGEVLRPAQANFDPEASAAIRRPSTSQGAVPAGRYQPNAWGLYDMHGNIFEWCRDWYHPRLPGGVDPDLSGQPGAPNRDGTFSRCRRGGAWNDPPEFCRSAARLRYEPDRRSDHIGFRVAAIER